MYKKICVLTLFIVVSGLASASAQNGLQGLRDYLKQYKYTNFVPPQSNAVVGSIVSYSTGFETIVSSKCLRSDSIKPSDLSLVGLAEHEGTLDRNLGIEGSFARAVDPQINLSGAFKDARVQKITIKISEPKETHLESLDVKEFISKLPPGPCLDALTNKHNRIYAGLLRIDSIQYKFEDKDGKEIGLDASLMKAIKLSPKYQKQFENKDELNLTTPIYIGYRAWEVRRIPGAVTEGVEVLETPPDDIAALKTSAKRKSVAPKPSIAKAE